MADLRPHQLEGVDAFLSCKTKFLAFEQGLGKSATAVEIARRLGARNILVICPSSVRPVWRHEIVKWSPEKQWIETPISASAVPGQETRRPRWRIVNYDRLVRTPGFLEALIASGPFDLCVIDEAHMLKDANAMRTRAVYGKLAKVCRRILPMSGTPMPNHAGELYTHVRALAPGLITTDKGAVLSQQGWENRYCQVELRRIGSRLVRVIKGSKNIPELRERLNGFMLRKTKAEVLPDLPPLEFVTAPIEVLVQPAALAEAARVGEHMGDDDLIRHLRAPDENLMRLIAELGVDKARAAGDYLFDFLLNGEGKIIVWFTHTAALDHVVSRLSDFEPVKIDGRSSSRDREAAVHKFLHDPKCRVFCGNIKAAGTGLTLLNETVQPRDVFFVESAWAPGDNLQAAARSHRIGARDGVLARVFVADGIALDERIQDIIARKANEIAQLI